MSLPRESRSESEERAAFAALQTRLRPIWEEIESRRPVAHTSVVVPSLSFDQGELAKIPGVPFFEERLLFNLIRLRHPRARLIYVSSQPIHSDIVDYYLQLLVGVPASHAKARLTFFCCYDASSTSLTEKILERPRLIARIREAILDPELAYLTCFNSTVAERRLAVELGIPLNGVDPDLLGLGTKSGSRRVFREAGIPLPAGVEDIHSRKEVVTSLLDLAEGQPDLRKAVVKLDESFAGEGNGIFRYPLPLPAKRTQRRRAIDDSLRRLELPGSGQTVVQFLAKLEEMGGIVEAFLEAEEVRSPSAQMRIYPDGELVLLSTHDQVLGGVTGQTYVGCRFPADRGYRQLVQEQAMAIGEVLRARGVISRFGVDFLVSRSAGGEWESHAIEINLRMGGTTAPFLALQFLTGGELDGKSGEFRSPRGQRKFYFATDSLRSTSYRGLLPEDLVDILTLHGLQFRPAREVGVLFHMIGALSEFGRLGVTCIGNSRTEADALYRSTVKILDRETGGVLHPDPFELTNHGFSSME